MRDNIILKCTVCGEEQYITSKNKKNNPDRIEKINIAHIAEKFKFSKKRNSLKSYD